MHPDSHISTKRLKQAIKLLLYFRVARVTVSIVWNYRSYLPPDFVSDFLQGRES